MTTHSECLCETNTTNNVDLDLDYKQENNLILSILVYEMIESPTIEGSAQALGLLNKIESKTEIKENNNNDFYKILYESNCIDDDLDYLKCLVIGHIYLHKT